MGMESEGGDGVGSEAEYEKACREEGEAEDMTGRSETAGHAARL